MFAQFTFLLFSMASVIAVPVRIRRQYGWQTPYYTGVQYYNDGRANQWTNGYGVPYQPQQQQQQQQQQQDQYQQPAYVYSQQYQYSGYGVPSYSQYQDSYVTGPPSQQFQQQQNSYVQQNSYARPRYLATMEPKPVVPIVLERSTVFVTELSTTTPMPRIDKHPTFLERVIEGTGGFFPAEASSTSLPSSDGFFDKDETTPTFIPERPVDKTSEEEDMLAKIATETNVQSTTDENTESALIPDVEVTTTIGSDEQEEETETTTEIIETTSEATTNIPTTVEVTEHGSSTLESEINDENENETTTTPSFTTIEEVTEVSTTQPTTTTTEEATEPSTTQPSTTTEEVTEVITTQPSTTTEEVTEIITTQPSTTSEGTTEETIEVTTTQPSTMTETTTEINTTELETTTVETTENITEQPTSEPNTESTPTILIATQEVTKTTSKIDEDYDLNKHAVTDIPSTNLPPFGEKGSESGTEEPAVLTNSTSVDSKSTFIDGIVGLRAPPLPKSTAETGIEVAKWTDTDNFIKKTFFF